MAESALPIKYHSLTMTGELVDLFDGRNEGVKQILSAMCPLLGDSEVMVYAGTDGILRIGDVRADHYPNIASANWLASATWAAQKMGDGLFVDIGSTTTDILLLGDGKVKAEGYSDYQRLITQELVYTGVVRTPVMAVALTAQDQGKEIGLMAEYFATMADVYRVTGELNEVHDQNDTADGAEKTVSASAKRLSRMVGCDYNESELPRWQQFAQNLRAQQLARIQAACESQLQRVGLLPKSYPVIGAGIGRFLVKEIAINLGYRYQDFSALFANNDQQSGYTVADCAPAVAIAYLAIVS
jgi:probable H4MPT-linked C1 transfer pathway protein